ncbi:hypothetical protein BRD17_01445 [Halobacteriales archaeon SW_7_68_16]|nr:MAG: hypothetical protein BRD17_01445 [Halobacteriales archaeon SW_7_68_16]
MRALQRALDIVFGGRTDANIPGVLGLGGSVQPLRRQGYVPEDRAWVAVHGNEERLRELVDKNAGAIVGGVTAGSARAKSVTAGDDGRLWVTITGSELDNLLGAIKSATDALVDRRFEPVCAVVEFRYIGRRHRAVSTKQVAMVYDFHAGAWYPFAPIRRGERVDTIEREVHESVDEEFELQDRSRTTPYWDVPF